MKRMETGGYLKGLRDRHRARRVTREYQLTGLTLAELLGDEAHKALYIKLAKRFDGARLIAVAKDVAERKNIKNKGAYFMSIIHEIPIVSKTPHQEKTTSIKARIKPD